jgi:hypothetical protein
MKTNPKRAAALRLLSSKGVPSSSSAPGFFRLLWKIGFDVPPPYFLSFWSAVAFVGIVFSLAVLCLLIIIPGLSTVFCIISSVVTGLFFGIIFAIFFDFKKNRYSLPSWREL